MFEQLIQKILLLTKINVIVKGFFFYQQTKFIFNNFRTLRSREIEEFPSMDQLMGTFSSFE